MNNLQLHRPIMANITSKVIQDPVFHTGFHGIPSPENRPSHKEMSLPTINFQGLCLFGCSVFFVVVHVSER